MADISIIAADRPTFIYGLIDPRNDQIRYVGKTVLAPKRRLATRIWHSKAAGRKHHRHAWLAGLAADGHVPEVVELEVVPPGADWIEAEQFWIAYFRSIGADLCNLTIGGDGAPGAKCSEERKERLRAIRGPLSPLYGKKAKPHVVEGMRSRAKRLWADPQWREAELARRKANDGPDRYANSIAALAAVRSDPRSLAAMEEKRLAACRAPERRSAAGVKSKATWQAMRQSIIAAQNAGKGDDFKRKQAEAKRAAWADPNGPYAKTRLPQETIKNVIALLAAGNTGVAIAKMLNISGRQISRIKCGIKVSMTVTQRTPLLEAEAHDDD